MCRVTFLHPDLGIGGAERLVVDAALALKSKNHAVTIVTTHHDPNRCFEETANGELNVVVVGDWIPRSIFNKFYAVMAYLRMIYAALFIVFSSLHPDVVICDLVSVAVPVLKLKFDNVIFYCHYPDQLLSHPGGILKRAYRVPLNWLEEVSIGKASRVFVNSKFTAGVFKDTFKTLHTAPEILYPSLNMNFFDSIQGESLPQALQGKISEDDTIFLSINRYERKKGVKLCLEAFRAIKDAIDSDDWAKAKLIIAGGYDSRVRENVEHFRELADVASSLGLEEEKDKVFFLKSPSDLEKVSLLKACSCLVYTPSNEHFGIVPVEAMYLGRPVIAVNSGGPRETIVDGETGFLREPEATSFAEAMRKFVIDKSLSRKLGENGRTRVSRLFSFQEFARRLNEAVENLTDKKIS